MNKEEITNILPDQLWDNPDFKKGFVLRFDTATLKVTKINRKTKRVWAEHIVLVEQIVADTHFGHTVDVTEVPPFCSDCMIPINEGATVEGKAKAKKRDWEELTDGTKIS